MSKTKSSIRNFIFAMISNVVSILIGFIVQKIFINLLGLEYLGLNGLFTNIVSMLGIVELGIGSAIVFNLYKPIKEKDRETIKSLMGFYKKAYEIIAVIVFIIAICLIPFLSKIVGKIEIDVNIYFTYFLFVSDIIFSYLLSYKRSILYANQENYIIDIIHIAYNVILNVSQLLILKITKNYYLYLEIKIAMRIIENVVITIFVNKKYPYLKNVSDAKKLDKDIENDIFTKIKALFFHQIGGFVINGTDNLIISIFLGVKIVGLYTNYFLIFNSVKNLFGQAISAVTPSVGNLLTEKNTEKTFAIFKKIRFVNFWIATFSGIAILIVMQPFVTIWVGNDYLLSLPILFILVINYFQQIMRYTYMTFKDAAGIFYEDRFVPIIEASLNIITSIILVKLIGLPGVFIGTIISSLALWLYSYPKFVYVNLFKRKYINYLKETIGYFLLFVIIGTIVFYISSLVNVESYFLKVVINVLISVVVTNVILVLLFFKSKNFKYLVDVIKNLFNKGKNVDNDNM